MDSRLAGAILFGLTALLATAARDAAAQSAQPPRSLLSSAAVNSLFRGRTAVNAMFAEVPPGPPPPPWTLQLGAAYADTGSDSSATTTPASLRLDLPDGLHITNSVQLGGDIYDWVRAAGSTHHGHGDPTLSGLHSVDLTGNDSLILGAGVTVPTGSPIGAASASQSGLAVYAHEFAQDPFAKDNLLQNGQVQIWGTVDHDNGASLPGVSSVSWAGQVYYYQKFPQIDKHADLFAVVSRSYRQGGHSASTLGVGGDFTVSSKTFGPFGSPIGTLTGTCGISAGHHCGTIELDIQLPFGT